MIPILYSPNEINISTNGLGLGKLTGLTECTATEEQNGAYELDATIVNSSPHYEHVAEGALMMATHDDGGDMQPFRIDNVKRGVKNTKIHAVHDAVFQLSGLPVSPPMIGSFAIPEAMQMLTDLASTWGASYPAAGKLDFSTDFTTTVSINKPAFRYVRKFLGGQENSLIDLLGGGELKYDMYSVSLLKKRGVNTGVRITYGKNLEDINGDTSMGECYTGAFYYYQNTNGILYSKQYDFDLKNTVNAYMPNIMDVDITSEFQNEPTRAEFETMAAQKYAAFVNKEPWKNIYNNISISWYELSKLSEYSHLPKRSVKLCDYVHVYYPPFGLDSDVEVVKVKWNVLRDRYDALELGTKKKSLYSALTGLINNTTRRT